MAITQINKLLFKWSSLLSPRYNSIPSLCCLFLQKYGVVRFFISFVFFVFSEVLYCSHFQCSFFRSILFCVSSLCCSFLQKYRVVRFFGHVVLFVALLCCLVFFQAYFVVCSLSYLLRFLFLRKYCGVFFFRSILLFVSSEVLYCCSLISSEAMCCSFLQKYCTVVR